MTSAKDTEARDILGHPRGLAFLCFSEGWERLSFYGMQSLLVLYMSKALLLPGALERVTGYAVLNHIIQAIYHPGHTPQALASTIFGLYASLVYLTPILGGFIADRMLGRTRTVILGGVMMAAGHFLLAFPETFLLALGLLILGCGAFKGNIASQVGGLYAPNDPRRTDAFEIYYLGITAGVVAAPLAAGTLGEKVGWHWGFGAAGVGMLIALIGYLAGRRHFPPEAPTRLRRDRAVDTKLTAADKRVLGLLVALLPVLACATLTNQQIYNAYLTWADAAVDLSLGGRRLPTTWLVTLDTVASAAGLALMAVFWRAWRRRFAEPAEIDKMALGAGLSLLAALTLAAGAARAAATGGQVGLGWCVAFHILSGLAFANLLPVSLALYARAAPAALSSMVIGIYYLHIFAANQTVGWLGARIEALGATLFWCLHAVSAGVACLAFFATARIWGPVLRSRG